MQVHSYVYFVFRQQAFPKSAILTGRISLDTTSKTEFGVRSAIGRAKINFIINFNLIIFFNNFYTIVARGSQARHAK